MPYPAKAVPDGRPSDIIRRLVLCFPIILSALLTFIVNVQEITAENSNGPSQSVRVIPDTETALQPDGQVIYRAREKGLNHLYIVGISHRDASTRSNGINTARVQSEVYRIGKWLIENKGIELLLPEGYFTTHQEKDRDHYTIQTDIHQDDIETVLGDREALREIFDSGVYVNAERLLGQSHHVIIQQVEDDALYHEVIYRLGKLENNEKDAFTLLYDKLELDYLQERRTAAILQIIPEVIDKQIMLGNIRHRNAMLTIGASHLSQIISCLEQKKLIIRSPAFTPFKDYTSEVNLMNEGFDITIIIPRSIADDGDLMSLMKLAGYKGQSSETLAASSHPGN